MDNQIGDIKNALKGINDQIEKNNDKLTKQEYDDLKLSMYVAYSIVDMVDNLSKDLEVDAVAALSKFHSSRSELLKTLKT